MRGLDFPGRGWYHSRVEVRRMQRRCWIVGAGDWCAQGWAPRGGDLVIAADGGQAPLLQIHTLPDVVVGDFDSLREAPHGGEIVRLPAEKDDTDMVAALSWGWNAAIGIFAFMEPPAAASTIPSPICRRSIFWPVMARGACWWSGAIT